MPAQINRIRRRHNGFMHSTYLWNIVFWLTMLVYFVGLFIPIMEPDAAVYAQVSMEMHDRGDYLSIYHKGVDWLDKPHFPFWMSALSYEIFGVNTFAYKLPAVLFTLLGAFYTFRFGKKFYSALHGWIAVVLLITAEHIIISNQDVRAEPFMTGLVIMGLYHFASLFHSPVLGFRSPKKVDGALDARAGVDTRLPSRPGFSNDWFLHAAAGSLAAACLIMTKGLFTIIPLGAGIGFSLLYQRNWKAIFSWRWLVVAVLIIVFLSPALYGYYRQFDLHPEKTIFGQNNVSGVEFFLWTSQWGRFTNTGPITGKGDPTFFIHTLLWAFLPWAFAAYFAIYHKIKQLFKGVTYGENFTFFGFITLFLIFSASRFQLSFYLNPLFPLLAILTTAALLNMGKRAMKTFSVIHLVVCILLVIGLFGLHYFFSANMPHIDSIAIVVFAVFLGFFLFSRRGFYIKKIVFATALIVLAINYYINRDFYPALLKYQAESEAAYFMKANNIDAKDVVFADEMESVADIIMQQPTKVVTLDTLRMDLVANKYVFTSAEGLHKLDSLRLNYTMLEQFEDFPVTRLTGKFINRATRYLEVKPKYLVRTGSKDMDRPEIDVTKLVR